jgi:DNA-binding transcriptional ArsR family regulator
MSRADLIFHPVRMRLLGTLTRRQLTARQLSELLPDVPQATLYHHLGMLTRGGLLRVISERPVRGATEKVYTLADDYATLGPSDLANASRDDHLRYFAMFISSLLGDYARYLEQDGPIDLFADGVGYREIPFYLSDEEFSHAAAAVGQALLPFLENQPEPFRRRRLFAFISFPDARSASDERHDVGRPDMAPES